MVRSAPPEKASLPEVMTQPLMASSPATVSMICSSSPITSGVMTFMERPGMSQVASAMPSASVSKRKLVKFVILSSQEPSPVILAGRRQAKSRASGTAIARSSRSRIRALRGLRG